MPIPHKFKAGDIASSSEVNNNFSYFESLIGELSDETELAPEKAFKFGSAGYVIGGKQISLLPANKSTNNIENAARGFINLTWNAKPNELSGRWERVNNLSGSSVIELGDYGIVMSTTNSRTGDLQSKLTPLFGVMNSDYDDKDVSHIYMAKDVPIITQYTNPNNVNNEEAWKAADKHQEFYSSLQRRRLTYVRLDEPVTVMENKYLAKGKTEVNVLSWGVPAEAAMIEVSVYCTATYASGAGLFLMPKLKTTHRKYGLICHAYGGNTAGWGRSAVQGKVPIYSGLYNENNGAFSESAEDEGGTRASVMVLEATAAFTEVSIYIQGYYV